MDLLNIFFEQWGGGLTRKQRQIKGLFVSNI